LLAAARIRAKMATNLKRAVLLLKCGVKRAGLRVLLEGAATETDARPGMSASAGVGMAVGM